MEASLPLSAEVKKRAESGKSAKPRMQARQGGMSIALPLMFMITGLFGLSACLIWLVVQPKLLVMYHYNPSTVAITHLFALGWLGSIVMGAMYQLVPVALETKLFSVRLATLQFAVHICGVSGMVLAFYVWNMKFLACFGSIFALGACLFIYNIAQTLLRVPKWNVIATATVSSLLWILFGVTAGLLIVGAKNGHANFMFHFYSIAAMHAHAHLGTIGFFTMLIVGVSYKLIPMFTLSEIQNHRRAAGSVILLNIGLAGCFVSILLQSAFKIVFALVIVGALVIYSREVIKILHARKRRALDWAMRYFLTAIALLVPLSILGLTLSWPRLPLNQFTGQLENAYGVLGFLGFISLAIVGMLYKIIPFLVWFGTYSKHVGSAQVPALCEMYSVRLQSFGYWLFLTALVVLVSGILLSNVIVVRAGCILFTASLLTLAINVGKILSHYFHPQLNPLPTKVQN